MQKKSANLMIRALRILVFYEMTIFSEKLKFWGKIDESICAIGLYANGGGNGGGRGHLRPYTCSPSSLKTDFYR